MVRGRGWFYVTILSKMAEKAETSGQREKENESKKSGPPPVAKAYLLLYNGLLTAGYVDILLSLLYNV